MRRRLQSGTRLRNPGRNQAQPHVESAARAQTRALGPDNSTMHFDNLAGDGQPQTEARVRRQPLVAPATEWLKHLLQKFWRDPDAGISDFDFGMVRSVRGTDRYRAPRGSVFDRINQQVIHHLLEPRSVTLNPEDRRRQAGLEPQSFLLSGLAKRLDRSLNGLV